MEVEVLSESTEAYDRGEKLAHYQQIPSLRGIIYAAQDERRLEHWHNTGDRWQHAVARAGESFEVPSLTARLDVDEIYEGIVAS